MAISRHAPTDYGEIADPRARQVGPIHPGVILGEEFLDPMEISAYALAEAMACRETG